MNFLKALGLTTALFVFVSILVGIFWALNAVFGQWAPIALLFLAMLLVFWFITSMSSHKQPWQ